MESGTDEVELEGLEKLVFDASCKILEGRKLLAAGRMELAHLLGKPSSKVNKSAKKDKVIANRMVRAVRSGFKKSKRTDEDLAGKILEMIKKAGEEGVATNGIHNKFSIHQRRIERVMDLLKSKVESRDTGKGYRWFLKERKVKGDNKHDRTMIKVEDHAGRVLAFIKSNDWVNKRKLVKGVNISAIPLKRVIDHLKKDKLVKEVYKSNNPAHQKVKKIYVQELPYLEAM